MGNRNKIVKIWIARSKDTGRTRKDRSRCWEKACELAKAAPGYTSSENAICRILSERPARAATTKYGYYTGGVMRTSVRIYRTREDGRPRTYRVTEAA